MKYNEDKILKEIGDYIKSTYGQHYSSDQKGFQVLEVENFEEGKFPRKLFKVILKKVKKI